jgi:hypothetical protein
MPSIDPKNLTAQLAHRGAGNPPGTHPATAISNCFPGLETDFRNAWKHILEGIELHEASNVVVAVDEEAGEDVRQLLEYSLLTVDGIPVTVPVTGPQQVGGPNVALPSPDRPATMPLEWSNALAAIVPRAGERLPCEFVSPDGETRVSVDLRVRSFFATVEVEGQVRVQPVIAREIAAPGELTQSLCSPWQNDYRECGCFYWAASRPDFVNIEPRRDGTGAGHNWMQKDRSAGSVKEYLIDDRADPRLVSYDDLFRDWEGSLRFIRGGSDDE